MSKKTSNWFSHDSNATNDKKIVMLIAKYGYTGYGYWWRLLEILRNEENYKYCVSDAIGYHFLAKELMCSVGDVQLFVQDCIEQFQLLKSNGKYIWNTSLIHRMEHMDAHKKTLSERGKKGAAVTNARKSAQVKKKNATAVAEADDTLATGAAQAKDFSAKEKKLKEKKTNETKVEVSKEEELSNTTPTPAEVLTDINLQTPLPFANLDDLKQRALADTVHFVPIHLRPGRIKTQEQLPMWLDAFNKWLHYGGEHVKSERDYRFHFNNWIQRQDLNKNPEHYNPLTDNKPIPYRRGQRVMPSPPPNPGAAEIRKEQQASRILAEERIRKLKEGT